MQSSISTSVLALLVVAGIGFVLYTQFIQVPDLRGTPIQSLPPIVCTGAEVAFEEGYKMTTFYSAEGQLRIDITLERGGVSLKKHIIVDDAGDMYGWDESKKSKAEYRKSPSRYKLAQEWLNAFTAAPAEAVISNSYSCKRWLLVDRDLFAVPDKSWIDVDTREIVHKEE